MKKFLLISSILLGGVVASKGIPTLGGPTLSGGAGSVNSNEVYNIALQAAYTVGGATGGVTIATANMLAATNSAWQRTNGTSSFIGNGYGLTNLSLDYVYPASPSVTPLPNIYTITTYGSNLVTEGEAIGLINRIYTNGYVAYGFDTVQMDAGWATRNASGLLVVQTNVWTNNLAYLCNYAHARGIKIGVYYSIDTNSGWNTFGQVNMYTHMQEDIDTLATNGVDLIKIDSFNSYQSGQDPIKFWNAVAKSGHSFHRQNSVADWGNTGQYYALSPAMASGLNSAYVSFGLPDTISPRNFTNIYAHFQRSLAARHYVSPSFKLEGTAWMWTGFRNQYPYPEHCAYDMALMTSERVLAYPDVDSMCLTNVHLWNLLQSSPVQVADIGITNGNDFAYSRWIGDRQNTTRAICFINTGTSTNTVVYNLQDLGFPKNAVVTYYSPWYWNSLEGWATNTLSVTVPPTNTILYKMTLGYKSQIPASGVTYLSDLAWDSTASIPRGPSYASYGGTLAKDYRDGNPATPLIIGSTTYTKGFGVGGGLGAFTNAIWTINTGYAPSQSPQLVLNFGKQQAWNGGSSGIRLTIWTNGVKSTASDFVTNNTTQATNFIVPLAGVRSITFMSETNGVTCQGVVGGAYITNSIP